MYLSNNTLYNYTINYNYSFKKADDSSESGKDGVNDISSDNIEFSLELSGNSKFERKDASERDFQFINLVENNN